MKIYIRTANTSQVANLAFSKELYGFYIAYAKIVDNKMVTYSSVNKEWADMYINYYQDDPIVFHQRPNSTSLSLSAWSLMACEKGGINFIQKRFSVTQVDFGITAYRRVMQYPASVEQERTTVDNLDLLSKPNSLHCVKSNLDAYEFFALGTRQFDTQQKTKILNCQFVQAHFENIVNVFTSHILR